MLWKRSRAGHPAAAHSTRSATTQRFSRPTRIACGTLPSSSSRRHVLAESPHIRPAVAPLTNNGGKTEIEEVWATRKIQFYHVTSVRQGDYVYGSTGMRAPAFMSAVNVKTGEIAWRKRGFAKANCLYADGKLIILDEDGMLYLATANAEDLTVHSQVELLDEVSWTVPTLVGKTLYVRDKKSILALDLG